MSRFVTVGSVSHSPSPQYKPDEPKPFFDMVEMYIKRASMMGTQILAFPEVYPHLGLGEAKGCAEEVGGPTSSFAMEMARKYNMHIIWPMWEREGDTLWNLALLIDRKGEPIGRYHKMFPTIGEMEWGIRPGEEANVFETEFGRVGMCICFDLNFRPILTGLKENGAEIIFFCSMYRGGAQVRAWAFELGCYMVSAIGAELGQIVDLTGKQLEMSTYEALITHRINLNRRLLHMDYNWDKMDAMLEKYGTDLTFDYVTPEACYAIGSLREGLCIESVIDEYGLLRREDYWKRVYEVRDRVLGKG
jgi:predicted amidohydrolase